MALSRSTPNEQRVTRAGRGPDRMGRGSVRVRRSGVSDLREGRRAGRHPDPGDARCHSRCARPGRAPGGFRFPRRDAVAVRRAGARADRRIHVADPGSGLRVGGVPGVRARRGARVQRMAARAGPRSRRPHPRSRRRRDRHVLHRRIRPRGGCRRRRARARDGGAGGAVPDQPDAARGSRCLTRGIDPGAGANPIRRPVRARACGSARTRQRPASDSRPSPRRSGTPSR